MVFFLENQILFYLSVVSVLFVPGYFLLLAVFGKSGIVSILEKFILSFGLSIVIVDFIFFLYSKIGISLTRFSTLSGIGILALLCFAIFKFHKQKDSIAEATFLKFTLKEFGLLIMLLFLTLFIKVTYLSGTVLPTSTDMGHHMYWSKWLVDNHALPTYDGMPDFIIGEHIIFGAIALIGGFSFLSAFPPALLLLVNVFSILAVFILVLRIFENKTIALLTLFFLGVAFAISSPQAKFVSGGVVGNVMGNLLVPIVFYFYYRAFSFFKTNAPVATIEKKFFALAIFTNFGLFYTHHLTSFIFLFVFAFLLVLFLLANIREIKKIIITALRMFFSPPVISVFVLCVIFFFFIFTPTYIKNSAVDTAVGTPSKATREGLSLATLKSMIGEARLTFGFIGLILLLFYYNRKNFGHAILISWATMIFVMSSYPRLIFINLPSDRIGNYLSYPLAILSAYGLFSIFNHLKFKNNTLIRTTFLLVFIFIAVNGLSDSAASITHSNDPTELVQTFHASSYLNEKTDDTDIILKDHNYITADSWMKLFFMRGYKYPDSRGYFKRYNDPTKPREMCTLYMISNPNSPEADNCFTQTNTKYLMVNPQFDSAQFKKLANFDQIYLSDTIAIYYKND
jgi:hypothetical protein